MSENERLIIRFLLRQLDGEEQAKFMAWLGQDEKNRQLFSVFRDIWAITKVRQELTAAAEKNDWEQLRRRIDTLREAKEKTIPAYRLNTRRWLQVAAVFLAGFTVSWFIFKVFPAAEENVRAYNEIVTPLGSRTTINLSDGSEVILNAGSKLRYPRNFSRKNREVYLEGEAFFNIHKDAANKFLVITPYMNIKVYGTRFNIKAYATDRTVETTLVEGRISVIPKAPGKGTRKKEIVLMPNQRLILYKKSGAGKNEVKKVKPEAKKGGLQVPKMIISKKVDPEYFTSWKDGRLIIKSERLDQLAVKLERRYDVHIHFRNEEVKAYRFTGIIENETVEQVFDAIKTASKINYKIKERDIWIDK